jgi:nicotinamide-nucleotide amidase
MKTRALDVPAALLAERTAVSAEVAVAMAEGALRLSPAGAAVSITGVVGPEPDEDGNPVGLVFCAVALRDQPTRVRNLRSDGTSPEIILKDAMRHALLLLQETCAAYAQGGNRVDAASLAASAGTLS